VALDKLTSDMITAGAVNAAAIADGTVVAAEIADDAVTTAKIADDAITTAKIPNSAITDAKISAVAATKLTGTVADARFPSTLPAASGVNLTALNATNLASGTVPTARLGSGTANNGVFLRGDGTWDTAGSTSASDLTSGTLPMARLSGTLPALNGSALTNLPGTKAEACNFHVTNAHTYNVTGQNQEYTCAFDDEISDVGSNFNTSTYTFTAPATGLYQISFGIKIHGLEEGTTDRIVIYLHTSNRGYYWHVEGGSGANFRFGESNRGSSFLVDMDASDTAVMKLSVGGQSAVNADFKGGSFFSGFRVT